MVEKHCFSLFTFFVLNGSVCFAQLSTLNPGLFRSGGLSDVVKFAHEEGFFKKNGLDVTLVYINSGVLASQVVASGTAGAAAITATDARLGQAWSSVGGPDSIRVDAETALRVMSAGVPMKIIMVNIDEFQHLFVARPGIKNPGDMKGKKVAVSRYGSFSDIQTRFLIRPQSINRAIKRAVAICEINTSRFGSIFDSGNSIFVAPIRATTYRTVRCRRCTLPDRSR